MTMHLPSSLFVLMMLMGFAACDVNLYPVFGRTVVAGGGQILARRPIIQQPVSSVSRLVLLSQNYPTLGRIVPQPVLPVQNAVGSAVFIGSDSYDAGDLFSDDRVVVIG